MQFPSTSQTSPQGLAAISMGNPATMQNPATQPQQNPQMGFPPDLAKAIVLQKALKMREAGQANTDSQKYNELIAQLQQVSGRPLPPNPTDPNAELPTVVQGLQQAAAQKLRQMPQQQGQPEQMAQAPQSAGIDQAPVEFGMAGGGIVSFNGEDASEVKSPEEQNKVDEEATSPIGNIFRNLRDLWNIQQARRANLQMPWEALTPTQKRARENIETKLSEKAGILLGEKLPIKELPKEVLDSRKTYSPPLGSTDPQALPPSTPSSVLENKGTGVMSDEARKAIEKDIREHGNPNPTVRIDQLPSSPATPATDSYQPPQVPSALQNLINQPTTAAKPMQSAAPAALSVNPAISKILALDPEAKQREYEERLQKSAPDTSNTDRLIAELEKSKQGLNRPKTGLAGLVDYFAQIAAAGPQRDWMSAGAKGALGVKALDKAAEQAQHDITVKQIEAAESAKEKKRLFQLEVVKAGQSAHDKTYEQVLKAAEEDGKNKRSAAEIASAEARNAATVAAQARGHTLNAQVELLKIQILDRRQASTDNKMQLKAEAEERTAAVNALRATAKEMGDNIRDLAFMAELKRLGKDGQYVAIYNDSIKALAKIGGVNTANMGFVQGPSTNVRAPLK